MAKSVSIVSEGTGSPLVDKTVSLLKGRITERCGVAASEGDEDGLRISLLLDSSIGTEGFLIEGDTGDAVRIVGNDECGLLYGAGKFLRDCRFGDGELAVGPWRGTSAPAMDVRGMYFASHFHNFYHDAPVEKIQRYVEDLALSGCNALSVWFDMHHFNGIDDPAARAMIERLRATLRAAQAVGISPGLTTLSNEGYANSPEELRADWTAGHDGYTRPPGGHYHREICPHKPGGLEFILKTRREMLEAFNDLNIGYVWIWPYDQGGCTCSECKPWGANGFLKTAEPVASLVRELCPGAKTVLSTWYFDHFTSGEWDGLTKAFADGKPDWVDYLLADDYSGFPEYPVKHGAPGGAPLVGFPEISMEGMWPWGGFGSNPRPRHWQEYWNTASKVLSGSFPYSEGIFEDLNKFIILQWEWAPERTVEDLIREYAAGCFSPDVAESVLQAVMMMEENHGVGVATRVDGKDVDLRKLCEEAAQGRAYELSYRIGSLPRAEDCLTLMNEADGKLPTNVRQSWRWRILWLRAAIDEAMKRSGGQANDEIDGYMEELTEIYHAQGAEPAVLPPSRGNIDDVVRRRGYPQI
ncbi:hypothetical protein ACFLSJ_01220 [Verrucomicrobiota bacterium]